VHLLVLLCEMLNLCVMVCLWQMWFIWTVVSMWLWWWVQYTFCPEGWKWTTAATMAYKLLEYYFYSNLHKARQWHEQAVLTWYFSDHASWIDCLLITNLMHWLLFIHKILFSSTSFEPQALVFRRIQLYTCSLWYCHSLWEFLLACQYTAWAVYWQANRNSHREWQYHRLHVYNCILLKTSAWGSKCVEEKNVLEINNNQCIKLVINT